MRLCDILTIDRIIVDADGTQISNKDLALKKLAELLSQRPEYGPLADPARRASCLRRLATSRRL